MKTRNQRIQKGMVLSLLSACLLMGVGCAKKSDGGGSSDTANIPATPTTSSTIDSDAARGADFAAGATAALQMDSLAALTAYVATHPLNNPTDLRISVKLSAANTNQYSGDVYVSYYDNGQYYTGHFNTDTGKNPGSGTLYPNYNHAYYNNWFTFGGKSVFHGFFLDSYGAVMLIVDQAVDQGDGSGASEVSGSIWFKNYANSQAYINPQGIPCWFITSGPYDCRTFLVSGNNGDGNLSSASALYPTQSLFYTSHATNPYIPEEPARGWRRLGTFSGLNKAKAFSQ